MKIPNLSDKDTQKDINKNRYLAMLSYVGILFLVPLLMRPNSHFAQFHARQGLVVFLGWVASSVLAIIPLLGWLASFILTIILFVVSVLGVLKVYAGEYWKVPYAEKVISKLKL